MATPVTNFGKVTVSTGYDAAAVTIVLATGHGSRLPSAFPFPLSWWDATTYSDPADDPNKEIVLVTARTGDTLTVTRAAEGTSASTKNTSAKTYKMVLGITKGMWDAIFTHRSLSQSFRGLHLSTHPDSDQAANVVRLHHADAIIMDNGEEVLDWNLLDASDLLSGAGGIDSGSRLVNTLYDIYAIYNGVNQALLLHRSKYYTPGSGQNYNTGEDATQGCRSAVDNSTVKVAQGFKVSTSAAVDFIEVKLIKVGAPTGNVWFTIEANASGVPSGTPLGTSDKLNVARLSTSAMTIRIPFRAPVSLTSPTQYHLVMQGDWTVSATNYVGWRMDGSAASYANGSKALFDSDTSTWTIDTDDDLIFAIYQTVDLSVVMPTGYTQKALIGFVYLNNSDAFKHFSQHDRTVFGGQDADWKIAGIASGSDGLISLDGFVPARPIVLTVVHYNGTGASVALGGLAVTDMTATEANERVGIIRDTIGAGQARHFTPLVLGPYQAFMTLVSAGTDNMYMSSYDW